MRVLAWCINKCSSVLFCIWEVTLYFYPFFCENNGTSISQNTCICSYFMDFMIAIILLVIFVNMFSILLEKWVMFKIRLRKEYPSINFDRETSMLLAVGQLFVTHTLKKAPTNFLREMNQRKLKLNFQW